MNRLTLIREIEKLEITKGHFENVLHDIESRYFDEGDVCFVLKTNDYNAKYNESTIKFNKTLMKEYLKKEIGDLESLISEKISLMK